VLRGARRLLDPRLPAQGPRERSAHAAPGASPSLRLASRPQPLRVVDPDRDEVQVNQVAQELARLFGVEVRTSTSR
tara:strand:+ start:184 stop:411 length:228 start_codon:yes stop_codon:yes gene_type:complete